MGADARAHPDAHQHDSDPRHDPASRQAAIDHPQSRAGSEKATGRRFDARADAVRRSAQQARAAATAGAAMISKSGPGGPRQRPRSTGVGLHGPGGDLVRRIGSPADPPLVPREEESGRPPLHRPRRHHAAVGPCDLILHEHRARRRGLDAPGVPGQYPGVRRVVPGSGATAGGRSSRRRDLLNTAPIRCRAPWRGGRRSPFNGMASVSSSNGT
jgi:hypothetical protein